MIEPISGKSTYNNQTIQPEKSATLEFATLFYREMVKESLKGEFSEMDNAPYAGMAKEIIIENLAKELARKNSSFMPDIKDRKESQIENR
ncbi:hypothetical protein A3J90_02410 [candidate division WOR-1 bacterium RIFOXYC2_FULL_37_10]|uniref:Uncharacterized protein n=1 Tax=candidate division WOR-1 bacterium RIFOXYB2_FULL_37_13 TaxID=1802579 RepID=A0A1F4SLA3_UNCSA|nr:MAG: hypothetical protein A2246_01605 [candidate division WOR-1 bacterium RIFOXYA2_FULL_37_7]OGC21147.1 MAG: hypothetical protein A2310_03895 [candidate division WOR-1 bacterium RIFOXYB2_FULL_37_13]OGC36246.1 MAG: hypothetical protein A3J90_02410 [candidate division WOR-1 bacterium RIFOXYC2_FULL_37_10]